MMFEPLELLSGGWLRWHAQANAVGLTVEEEMPTNGMNVWIGLIIKGQQNVSAVIELFGRTATRHWFRLEETALLVIFTCSSLSKRKSNETTELLFYSVISQLIIILQLIISLENSTRIGFLLLPVIPFGWSECVQTMARARACSTDWCRKVMQSAGTHWIVHNEKWTNEKHRTKLIK